MAKLFEMINKPLAVVLRLFCGWFGGNFAASVAIFTLLINIVLLPLSIKSQKSSVQQMRLKPKLDELKRKYGNDRQRMAQEQQKLYQQEGVSMSGGCLPLIVRLLIMISIYNLINRPLTYLMGVSSDTISKAEKFLNIKSTSGSELKIIGNASKLVGKEFDSIISGVNKINFKLFGIDLTQTPKFDFDFSKFQLIWLIPIIAFAVQILTSLLSMAIQKKNNPDAPNMAFMMLTMPLITLWIGFTLPGGVGFYWICSSLIGGILQAVIQVLYGPNKMLAKTRAKELEKQLAFETKQIANYDKSTLESEEEN